MRLLLLFTLLFIISLAKGQDPCNLLSNSDFEANTLVGPGQFVQTNQSNISSWKTTASDGMIEVWGSGFLGVPAYSGNQFIELNANQVSTIYQDFTPKAGSTVTVYFAHRGRNGDDVMSVSIGPVGGPYVDLGQPFTAGNQQWEFNNVTYTFPNTITTKYSLRFNSISAAGGATMGNFLDGITINFLKPSVTLNAKDAACGNPGSITSTVTSGNPPYSFSWYPNSNTTSNATNLNAGSYTLTVTDKLGCVTKASATIASNNTPISITKTVTICQGQTYAMGGQVYSTNGTYVANLKSAGGCDSTVTLNLSVDPTVVDVKFSSTTVCENSPTQFTDLSTSTNTISSWSWDFNNDGKEDNNTKNPSSTLTGSGAIPVTLTVTSGSCTAKFTQNVTVDKLAIANAGSDQDVCEGTDITLTGTIGGSATSATWSGGAGIFSPSNTSLNATYTPAASEILAGSVNLTITTNDPAGACNSASDQVKLTVNKAATISAGSDKTIDIGQTVILDGSIGGSAKSATWSGGTGTYAPSPNTLNALYTPGSSDETAGKITLTLLSDDPIGPCPAVSDDMVLTINIPAIAISGNPKKVCKGNRIPLEGKIAGSASSCSWSGGAGIYTPDNATPTATYTPTQAELDAGSVTLTLTTDDPIGPFGAASSTVTHTFHNFPAVKFSGDSLPVCAKQCVNFIDSSSVENGTIATWEWNFGDGNTSSLQNPTNCYKLMNIYGVSLKVTSDAGCTKELTKPKMVIVLPVPIAEFSYTSHSEPGYNPSATYKNESSYDVINWTWSFGDGDSMETSVSTNPVHQFPSPDVESYNTTLIVKNPYGCIDTVTHNVVVKPSYSFYIPNSFSPNDDKYNDTFYAKTIGVTDYTISIWDSWGKAVFEGNAVNAEWNGKTRESQALAPQGVYVWKVTFKDLFDQRYEREGIVTLVR